MVDQPYTILDGKKTALVKVEDEVLVNPWKFSRFRQLVGLRNLGRVRGLLAFLRDKGAVPHLSAVNDLVLLGRVNTKDYPVGIVGLYETEPEGLVSDLSREV